jgi:predicted GIY-YIG superfamily endonuclease
MRLSRGFSFTGNNGPFILLHFERFNDKSEAILRERFLKSGKGREFLDKILRG